MPPPPEDSYTKTFREVLAYELRQVVQRRKAVCGEEHKGLTGRSEAEVRRYAQMLDLFGLALSGGGIRSATFSLGVLQALASLNLLKRVDYISSVSGGGYIHGWLAAWVRREVWRDQRSGGQTGIPPEPEPPDHRTVLAPVENVSRQLAPSRVTQATAARRNDPDSDKVTVNPANVLNEEPTPVRHLREFSRYLAPQAGLFSLDGWSLAALYLRSLVANLPLFLGGMAGVACLCFVILNLFALPWFVGDDSLVLNEVGAWVGVGAMGGCLIFAQVSYRRLLAEVRERINSADSPPPTRIEYQNIRMRLLGLVVAPSLLASFYGLWAVRPATLDWSNEPDEVSQVILFGNAVYGSDVPDDLGVIESDNSFYLSFSIVFVAFGVVAFVLRWLAGRCRPIPGGWRVLLGHVAFGLTFGLALAAVVNTFGMKDNSRQYDRAHPALLVTVGPPLLLLAMVAGGALEAVIAGPHLTEQEREWRSRTAALTLVVAVVWAAVFGVALYLPWAVLKWLDGGQGVGGWAAGGGWVASGVGTFLLRWLANRPADTTGGRIARIALAVLPWLFLTGIFALVSFGTQRLALFAWSAVRGEQPPVGDFLTNAAEMGLVTPLAGCLLIALLALAYSRLVEPNLFSLHPLYGNRLVRCYLAASRRKEPHLEAPVGVTTGVVGDVRADDPFTGFDHRDDLSLHSLRGTTREGAMTDPYLGPYPLFNTTINLVGGTDLANQDRKGESFFLSPDYSGSNSTGFARFLPADETAAGNLTVGRAMTISGAAIDPNMHFYQSAGFTALLTLLNLRLGWWVQNPNPGATQRTAQLRRAEADLEAARQERATAGGEWVAALAACLAPAQTEGPADHHAAVERACNALARARRARERVEQAERQFAQASWQATGPRSACNLLWAEAIGDTRADGEFVHLSDGGHFDNTGGYELIRRRCRFVVLVDAAEDTNDASENLANLIRLVRTDFGIRIQLDTSPLRKGADSRSPSHVAVGLIRYDDVDHGAVNGTLLFIRSSLTGDEPADLLNYAITNPPFPHHHTVYQFFDEPQFESYRALGHHIGMAVFGPAKSEIDRQWERGDDDVARKRFWFNRRLFSELRRHWARLPADLLARYHSSVDDWLRIETLMREDDRLARLTTDMFRELGQVVALDRRGDQRSAAGQTRTAEVRAMGELVQMMESAYLKMELDDTFSHPVQRGWMNCLRRYTAAGVFQEYWPVLRPLFSHGFVRFCERVLNVAPLKAEAVWCATGAGPFLARHRDRLADEFDREWASVLHPKFDDWEPNYLRTALADAASLNGKKLIWLFRYESKAPDNPLPDFPIGIAVVRKWEPTDPDDDTRGQGYYELVFWVRGAYRSSGVGRDCLKRVMDELTDAEDRKLIIPGARFLFARFPRTGGTPADSLQRAVWTTFFNDHDFSAFRLPSRVAEWEIRVRYPVTAE